MHSKRSADYVPLSRVTNLEEGRDFRADTSTRAKIGKEIMLVLENNDTNSRKNSDRLAPGGAFAHAVRVLMFGYALVSASDSDESLWVDLQAAFMHIAKVEKLIKLDSKTGHTLLPRIRESEANCRNERAKACQVNPDLSLSEIATVISHRHALWPGVTEFPTAKKRENDRTNVDFCKVETLSFFWVAYLSLFKPIFMDVVRVAQRGRVGLTPTQLPEIGLLLLLLVILLALFLFRPKQIFVWPYIVPNHDRNKKKGKGSDRNAPVSTPLSRAKQAAKEANQFVTKAEWWVDVLMFFFPCYHAI